MADSGLKFSTDASGLKENIILETPEKEDSQIYPDTPVSSVRRSRTPIEDEPYHPASQYPEEYSSYSVDSRAKIFDRSDLDKIRVSLFHDTEQKNNSKAPIIPVNATSFYGNNGSRYIPLAPNILGTANKRIDKRKSNSPSLYDFPNKRVTRNRKAGGINSGVGHGIKKLKSKANSIKHESPEIDEDTLAEKQCEASQKENVGKVENSQSTEEYNPNKKFFKHKRPAVLQIDLGRKQKQKKHAKQEETIVNYSNVFDSIKSKRQFRKKLSSGQRTPSNSEAQSPVIIKTEILDQNEQYQQNSQKLTATRNSTGPHSAHSEKSNYLENETENEVDEGSDQELPYEDLAMDIENNNFSNNEMMTDVAVHDNEELKRQLTVGNNLFLMESLATDEISEQNSSGNGNSSDTGELTSNSGSEKYQKIVKHSDVRNIQCQECRYFYELGNKNEEIAHSNYHTDFVDKQLEKFTKDDSLEITIGNDSIIIVKPFGPKNHREKAFEVLRFIKTEMNLSDDDLIDNQSKHFFMYVREKSIIGIIVAEYLNSAFRLESDSSVPYRLFTERLPVKCGINIIWVTRNHRRQGIATKMMDCLRDRFCSNYKMDVNDIAFSMPTRSGRYFVEKYLRSCDFNVF